MTLQHKLPHLKPGIVWLAQIYHKLAYTEISAPDMPLFFVHFWISLSGVKHCQDGDSAAARFKTRL